MKMIRLSVAAALVLCGSWAMPAFSQNLGSTVLCAPAAEGVMTQGEFARKLCEQMGLYRFLPANPSALDCMILLTQNGIFPSLSSIPTPENPNPGWNLAADAPLTVAEMAVLLVRAMGMEDTVQGDVADPANWLAVVANLQIPTDPAGALGATGFLRDIESAIPIFALTGDALTARPASEDGALAILSNIILPVITPNGPAEQGKPPTEITPT